MIVSRTDTITITASGADQAGFLVEAYVNAQQMITEGHAHIFHNAMEAHRKQQEFIDRATDMMLDRMYADLANGKQILALRESLIAVSRDARLEAIATMATHAHEAIRLGLKKMNELIQSAVQTRMVLINQENKKLEILIQDKEAAQKLAQQTVKNDDERNGAETYKNADLLHRQYNLYLDAYNKDSDIANAISEKHKNVKIVKLPPTLNPLTRGYVRCTGTDSSTDVQDNCNIV